MALVRTENCPVGLVGDHHLNGGGADIQTGMVNIHDRPPVLISFN